ncbi:hypothetical protein DRQ07_08140, partial [candidate division KSB1 bacterium]
MPTFEFKAITPTGQIVTDVIDAPSEKNVTQDLLKKGYRLVAIKRKKVTTDSGSSSLFGKKIKTEQKVLFIRQLVTLLRAGVPMLTALEALNNQTSKEMSEILNKIYVDVMSGKSFSQALDQHPKVFSKLFVNSVRAGELSGSLDDVLERMAMVLQHEEDTNKKVKSAMKYPMFVISAMFVAMIILMTQVVPKFVDMLAGMGQELPMMTKILIGFSDFIQSYVLYIVGFLAAGGLGFYFTLKTEKGRYWWDGVVLKIPLIGPIILKSAMSRFTTMFETLNRSGLPILQTLNTIASAVGNKVIEEKIKEVAVGVENGQGIAGSMKKFDIFPKMVLSMISIG